jgi:hypothetical protein
MSLVDLYYCGQGAKDDQAGHCNNHRNCQPYAVGSTRFHNSMNYLCFWVTGLGDGAQLGRTSSLSRAYHRLMRMLFVQRIVCSLPNGVVAIARQRERPGTCEGYKQDPFC